MRTVYIYSKEIMYNFIIKIITNEFITWSIIVKHDFDGRYNIRSFFFFFVLYIYMLYTQLNNVCILKNISLFYKEDLVSRCIYIHIKVYMYITYFRISKLKFIFSYTHIYIFTFLFYFILCCTYGPFFLANASFVVAYCYLWWV